jgi:hypothetical protein
VGGGMAEARHDAARDVRASLRNVAECMVAVWTLDWSAVDWCDDVVTVSGKRVKWFDGCCLCRSGQDDS